jgi:thiamine pyrophosphokinase
MINIKKLFEDGEEISAIIVLNAPPLPKRLPSIWGRAKLRLCADGGANELHAAFGTTLVPDAVVGDLDSLRDDIKVTWENLGVKIEKSSCQNSTDLDKCVAYMQSRNLGDGMTVIVGTLGAQRLDQLMAVINTCFSIRHVVIIGEECLTLFMKAGENSMIFPEWLLDNNRCGLIPMFCPVDAIMTSGLRWELRDQASKFGSLVSSSNEVVNESLTVHTSHPLLFTLHHNLL